MLIISDFKDYYDSIAHYGIDKSIIFQRKEETINLFKQRHNFKNKYYYLKDKFQTIDLKDFPFEGYYPFEAYISICGKVYPFYKHIDKKTKETTYFFKNDIVSLNDEEIKDIIQDCSSWLTSNNLNAFKNHFKKDFNETSVLEVHRVLKTPIFVIEFHEVLREFILTKNPCLKEYNFVKYVDSYSMFQQIQQFLSNHLVEEKDSMIKLSDKELINKHGFDKKSFRKDKDFL